MAVLGISLVDERLVVSRLPNAGDILLSVAAARTVPQVTLIVPHWLCSAEHL